MRQGRGKGLDYDITPDIVQAGAKTGQSGAASPKPSRSTPKLSYDITPDLVQAGAEARQSGATPPHKPQSTSKSNDNITPDRVQTGAEVSQSGSESHQTGAKSSQSGAILPPKSPRPTPQLNYDPEPFPGARAPAGPSPLALATLQERGLWEPETIPETIPLSPQPSRPLMEERASEKKNPLTSPVVSASPKPATVIPPRTTPPSRSPVPPMEERAPERILSTVLPTAPILSPPAQEKAHPPVPPVTPPPQKASTMRVPVHPQATPKGRSKSPTDPEPGDARVARTVRLTPAVDAQLQTIANRFGVDFTAAVAITVTHGYQALAAAGFVRAVELK